MRGMATVVPDMDMGSVRKPSRTTSAVMTGPGRRVREDSEGIQVNYTVQCNR
ncbi:hypothetical protein GCM10010219_57870 [Streptomyces netropsis]|nr:hypothetical protein GCM10010219_57870 [Streptomyces netropsis]